MFKCPVYKPPTSFPRRQFNEKDDANCKKFVNDAVHHPLLRRITNEVDLEANSLGDEEKCE